VTDKLVREAAAGRGLWIGIPVPVAQWREENPLHPLLPWLGERAHVTLLHMGKHPQTAAMRVATALAAARAAAECLPVKCAVTGLGWFSRRAGPPTRVALVNSPWLTNHLRPRVYQRASQELALDDWFGFIPHVTLTEPANTSWEDLEDTMGGFLGWRAEIIQVHCGEVTVDVGLPEMPF